MPDRSVLPLSPRGVAPPVGATAPDDVVFVCHAPFDSNSGGHVCHFANGVAAQGVQVTVIARGDPREASIFGPPRFQARSFENVAGWAASLGRGPRRLVHSWTTRQRVVEATELLCETLSCPYIVHLEDDERHVTEAFSGYGWDALSRMSDRAIAARVPLSFSRPRVAEPFLAGASGVTVIVDSLREVVPPTLPVHRLEPGVEGDLFAPNLAPARAAELRRELGVAPTTRLVVYHGNGHVTNRRELFSLYVAVLILRRRGHDVRLLRFGKDTGDPLDVSFAAIAAEVAISFGYVDRDRLIECLKLADVYVQPGRPDRFNDLRLPSKLPEFLSLGRPVVLPRTNLGLRLAHDEDAVTVEIGDGERIAAELERLLADDDLRARLGENGRRFAIRHFDWARNSEGLLRFYGDVLAQEPAGRQAGS